MKKWVLSPVLGIFLTFCSSAALLAQGQVQAPAFKEGDTWQYNVTRGGGPQFAETTAENEGMYELVITQGGVKLYKLEGSQKTELVINEEGPTQGLLTLLGKSNQRRNLKFPLSVGQKWTYSYSQKPAGARKDREYNVEVNVAGIEQVATPAGSFKAYKLVANTTWGVQGQSAATYFYSSETKSIVERINENKNSGTSVKFELIKFTPGS